MPTKRLILLAFISILATPILAFSEPLTFKGSICTKDCSGHKAGYKWAIDKGITSPEHCESKSNSFTEGCLIWVYENQDPSETHSVDK